jgi:hypothetical protein
VVTVEESSMPFSLPDCIKPCLCINFQITDLLSKAKVPPSVVAHTWNPCTQEAEGRAWQLTGQIGLINKFKISLDCTESPCLKSREKNSRGLQVAEE